jgi:hypothetical protein
MHACTRPFVSHRRFLSRVLRSVSNSSLSLSLSLTHTHTYFQLVFELSFLLNFTIKNHKIQTFILYFYLFRMGPQWVRPQNSLSVELCLVIFFVITEEVLLKQILASIGHNSLFKYESEWYH